MAIFGSLEVLKQQVKSDKFKVAFEYLDKVFEEGSIENKRLRSLALDSFEKVDLDENNFALEQVYDSKERVKCFFESHKQNIDVQVILEGEEIIEVCNNTYLDVSMPYSDEMDLIKYKDSRHASIIKLQKGDVAIFYPEDAHMPCVKLNSSVKVLKTVVKVRV